MTGAFVSGRTDLDVLALRWLQYDRVGAVVVRLEIHVLFVLQVLSLVQRRDKFEVDSLSLLS